MKKIGIRILGCMALLSMVGCGRIEGASVQDLSNTKDAIVESETTLAENNNEYSNKNSLFYRLFIRMCGIENRLKAA